MFKLFSKISIKCHKSFLSIAIPLIKAKSALNRCDMYAHCR